jgi:hypothetical protein
VNFSEDNLLEIIKGIYTGKFTPTKLPKKLFKSIADYLTGGVYKGYGSTISVVEYNSPDFVMLQELRMNVHLFSAAKTFNYVLSTENLIVEGNKILPFDEFKTRALQINKQYNEIWLETEYNTAITQAQSARAWQDFSPDAILKYMLTDGVEHAAVCLAMQGVERAKSDSIWLTRSPLNHFGCLCYLDASYDNKTKPLPKDIPEPEEGFKMNAGIDKKVFDKDHPYFDVPKKYKKFAKEENFGLSITE